MMVSHGPGVIKQKIFFTKTFLNKYQEISSFEAISA